MQNKFTLVFIVSAIAFFVSCQDKPIKSANGSSADTQTSSMEMISKPYARYWWFASEITKEDIRFNLDWLKENGFGGVEIAWVYPLNSMDKRLDTSYTPRQKWLSPEWQDVVGYAIKYADSIGLACDLTMGTLWPFGDSYVEYEEAAQRYGEDERQVITRSWEYPKTGYVVDHLNPENYMRYFKRMLDSFPQPETRIPQAYFIDSWEVETRKLWADGLGDEFIEKNGYDISPFMDSIYDQKYNDQRYDYMKLISEKVIEFYQNYDRVLNDHNIFSRGQCSGAPCDIISAYARLDIPEGEAMLYEPEFNAIPASAALLSGKTVVSAETFTCLYGWPRDYIRQEQTADLKLVADALFANGVNHIVWHGKPHNPAGHDTISFYASVHIGKEGALAPEIPAFNTYLKKISEIMKKGRTYSNVAVYLPTEDAWMKGVMPKEKQFIWAWGFYEMRYACFPEELAGYHPIWINKEFLEQGSVRNDTLIIGNAVFNSLYINVDYLDLQALLTIYKLAGQGLNITLKGNPSEPGLNKHEDWKIYLDSLKALPVVSSGFKPAGLPLIGGEELPSYWAREECESLYIFFANPLAEKFRFPVEYGQSYQENHITKRITINYMGKSYDVELIFEPYQSLLYCIEDDDIRQIDIEFIPKGPEVKKSYPGHKPWMVK